MSAAAAKRVACFVEGAAEKGKQEDSATTCFKRSVQQDQPIAQQTRVSVVFTYLCIGRALLCLR